MTKGVTYSLVVPILGPILAIRYSDGAPITREEWQQVLGQPKGGARHGCRPQGGDSLMTGN